MSGSGADRRPARRSDGPDARGDALPSHGADLAGLADVVSPATDDAWRPTQPHASRSADRPGDPDDTLAQLHALGETVVVIGAAFDLTSHDLAAHEGFDRIEAGATVTVPQIVALAAADVQRWFALLDDDLTLALFLEGLDPAMDPISIELRGADDAIEALETFQQAAQGVFDTQGDSVNVSVRLTLGKRRAQRLAERVLAERRAEQSDSASAPEAALVFYRVETVERLLTLRAAAEWGKRGLGGGDQRLCVFLCEGAGYLAGPALEVIGAARDDAPEWLTVSRAALRRFAERMTAERRLREAESAWSGFSLAVAPEHLWLVQRETGLARIAERVNALRAQVAACALASHVERGEGGESGPQGDLTLRFAGARPAMARLASGAPPADLEGQPRDALIALANWAYRDASPEKLAIARQALADTLAAGATLTLGQLSVAASTTIDTARANFAIYLRGATERYFELRASAQQTVSGFAEATRKAVTDLTSDVTDNLFRTVGLIVGVLIAWLIQPGASYTLAHIATFLYTLYVLFIIAYLLRARRARYDLERKALDDTLAAMVELTQAERERVRQPARDAERHFEQYFRLTRAMYVALAIIGALLFLLMFLPAAHTFASHVAVSATPTPTPKR